MIYLQVATPYIVKIPDKFNGACVLVHPGLQKIKILHREVSSGADDYEVYKDVPNPRENTHGSGRGGQCRN